MKLVVAVIHADDAGACADALADAGVPCTRLGSTGGFLQRGNSTLLAGVDDTLVDRVIAILREHAHRRVEQINPMPTGAEAVEFIVPFPVEVEVGGATVFVLDVERLVQL